MADRADGRAAFYSARGTGWRQWWTLLHPPYTAWHLGYVVLGADLAPTVDATTLVATVVAFFLAVGVGAHALDEHHGHPLRTGISDGALSAAAVVSLTGAAALGGAGVSRIGWVLLPFVLVGPVLVVAYNAELFGGVVHTDYGFAAAWGAFPLLTAFVAQARTVTPVVVLAAGAAFALSMAQRRLSTPARHLRRHAVAIEGSVRMDDGTVVPLDRKVLLRPLEGALGAMSWAVVLGAASLAIARLT